MGAVALKDSVYALPATDRSREGLRAIVAEAIAGGGTAYLCEARFDDPRTDEWLAQGLSSEGAAQGRTWTTRRGVQIDRIASAWLIRRFIDARARFRFIDGKEPRHPDELRFDMVDGDYTHEGDRCTFESLVAHFRVRDKGVGHIAEIVHEIDLKDGKFSRPEAPGFHRLITGLILSHPEDEARLKRGFTLFDELHLAFSAPAASSGRRSPGSR
jgi:hypothetical protein